jgi:hypothetical protein
MYVCMYVCMYVLNHNKSKWRNYLIIVHKMYKMYFNILLYDSIVIII